MFFPKNKSYGLASVAGNADKISALEHEFEIVRKRMDAEAKKGYKLHDQLPYLHKTCLMVCNSAHLWMPATALEKKRKVKALATTPRTRLQYNSRSCSTIANIVSSVVYNKVLPFSFSTKKKKC
jgi:pre-mRNA-splicing factor CDC5/CEF1